MQQFTDYLTDHKGTVMLLAIAIFVLLPLWYVYQRRQTRKNRAVQDWQREIPIQNQWVPDKVADRLRHELAEGETEIVLITRKSEAPKRLKQYGAGSIIPLYIGAPIAYPELIEWYTVPFVWLFSLVSILSIEYEWRYNFLFMTDRRLSLVYMPPDWLPWLAGNAPTIMLWSIDTAKVQESGLAKLLGKDFGGLEVDSPADSDSMFHDMKDWPRAKMIRDLILARLGRQAPRQDDPPQVGFIPRTPVATRVISTHEQRHGRRRPS